MVFKSHLQKKREKMKEVINITSKILFTPDQYFNILFKEY